MNHTNQPLPWEWRPEHALRTVIFPAFIAMPLYVVKLLHIDYNFVVVYLPYVYHCVFILLMDKYFHKLCHKTIGQGIGSTIALSLYLFNHTFCQQMHRLFTCSYETILGTISLYYFGLITE